MGFLSEPISIIPLRPQRKIGNINVQVVIQENTNDTLTITKQPVQQGASITDHSYKEPTALAMTIYFQSASIESLLTTALFTNPLTTLSSGLNGLAKIYQSLLDLQNSRMTFDVVTPKRVYHNMLIATLSNTTDKYTENVLKIDLSFQEAIIVPVATIVVPRTSLKNPGSNGATQAAGKKSSFLSTATSAVKGLFGVKP